MSMVVKMPTNVGRKIVNDDSLILYIDASNPISYPGSGDTWFDLTKYQNHGTLINGPTFDSANGGSFVFDGSDDYVSIPPLSFTEDFTVNFWEIITGGIISNNQCVLGNVGSGDDINHYLGRIRLYNSDLGQDPIISTQNTLLNVLYNYTFTRQGTTYRIYINGFLDQTTTYPIFSWDISAIGSGNLGYFNGRIPIVQIYNRALTAQEIQQNYNALKGRFGL